MGIPTKALKRQEDPYFDLTLSQLHRWQKALGVPLANLLLDNDLTLGDPILTRARLVRAMKTAQSIRGEATDASIQVMAKMLVNQLIEIMPELKDIGAWPTVGQRRTCDEVGRIEERPVSDRFAIDSLR